MSGTTGYDWGPIIEGVGKGAEEGVATAARGAKNKRELREGKRRNLASLLDRALRRDQKLYRNTQEYEDELNDYKNQAMQHVARGFVDAFRGSNRGY